MQLPDRFVYVTITRPGNLLITAFAVFIAGVISRVTWANFTDNLIIASISAALIAAGGNIFNDYCDRDLDRVQKPHRPLPSGKIRPETALKYALICFLSGILSAVYIGIEALIIAAAAALLLILYSRFWKRMPLIGNIAVALIASSAFIYGGVAVGAIDNALWAASLAFLFHLGREIIKDLEDHQGDAAHHANTLVVRCGPKTGRLVSSLVFLLLALFLPLPYLYGGFQFSYLVIVLTGVLPVLGTAAFFIWFWMKPRELRLLSNLLKWDMLVGICALYIGRPVI